MLEYLKDWIKENNIDAKFGYGNAFEIDGKDYLLVEAKEFERFVPDQVKPIIEYKIFDEEFNLILNEREQQHDCDFYVFNFGGIYYYTAKGTEKEVELDIFKYVGKAKQDETFAQWTYAPLGVHGKFEVMNGSREYSQWVKKAKFLGNKSLGICERNTLAGILSFQMACDEAKIKPILGETVAIKRGDDIYFGKCYVVNRQGWKNLLKINKTINVDNDGKYIDQNDLLKYGEGLIFVFNYFYPLDEWTIEKFNEAFFDTYFQIDSVIWSNEKFDLKYLHAIKDYLDNWYGVLPPVLINDMYYIDKEDYRIKKTLNKIVEQPFYQNSSKNQHFKPLEDFVNTFVTLFKDDQKMMDFVMQCIGSTADIEEACTYKLELGKFHLPKFNFDHLPDSIVKSARNSKEFFINLVFEKFQEKPFSENPEYWERLDTELNIIQKGEFEDYFLILWDLIRWCKEENILTGLGRGSAAGSLIAYLLDITRVDPIPHDLLFERFLNEGRIGKSLPDIDTDFEIGRREDVKQYIQKLYGKDYFCNIGAFVNLKIKSGIKDLGRMYKINYTLINVLTSNIDLPEGKDGNFDQLFVQACKSESLKAFIKRYPKLINDLFYVLKQPKAAKIHPCATVILPRYEGEDIFDYIPVRKDGNDLISEWEGDKMEAAGFLKEDILGLEQLDKFNFILKLIKGTTGKDIDIYNLPLNELEVMSHFGKGLTGDIFQFGSVGLTSLCKQVQPVNIGELAVMLALFRPGPMKSGSHHAYANIKFGRKIPEYDWGLEEVTKETLGLIVYQEQVMKAMRVLGDFTPVETDDIRKAMGKKKESLLKKYKGQFINNTVKKGCTEQIANEIWDKMVSFSAYGFNKSHAIVYAQTSYISQWLKVHYPLQFWTSAFQFIQPDKDKKENLTVKYISEIKRTHDEIKIIPPDINISDISFKSDFKTNRIYWSLSKVKYLGQVGISAIIDERNKNGKFYSLEDFVQRVPKGKVDRGCVTGLILSGCFDEVYGITEKTVTKRKDLLIKYCQLSGFDIKKLTYLEEKSSKFAWWWILSQKELTGLGHIDYKEVIETHFDATTVGHYVEAFELTNEEKVGSYVTVAGVIKKITPRKSAKGPWALITLESNDEEVFVYCWASEWAENKDKIEKKDGCIFISSNSRVQFDKIKDKNVIHISQKSNIKIVE